MDFWRSGSARSHREGGGPRRMGPAGLWQRITGFYFPPWVPVVGIIVIVFGVLGLLFFTRSATGAPRIGQDHWHAPYQYIVCGERQPSAPVWEGGVHTHGDGIIHIHPGNPSEEGPGSRLVKWFEYGGGKLDGNEVRLPGSSKTYKNGDACPDGRAGEVQVFANGAKVKDYTRYLPRDGDQIRIAFGPPEEVVQEEDRIIISEDQATRTVEMTVSGEEEGVAVFNPASIEVNSGETVKIVLHNTAAVSHGLRISGIDGQYGTSDDFILAAAGGDPKSSSGVIEPGKDGFVVVRFDASGEVEFRDEVAQNVKGKIIVRATEGPTPTPSTPAQEPVDATLDVAATDAAFQPVQLTVGAGQKFRINLKNDGQLAHNLRIDGPDGQFRTDDDLVSADVLAGETKDLVGKIDTPGTYHFRDDYHPTQLAGTITVQ